MNKVILWVCRVYVGLVSVVLLFDGFRWGFFLDLKLVSNGIDSESVSVLGRNMIRSDIGGSLIAISILSALFLFKGKQWVYPVIIFTGSLLFIRVISLVTDGYHQTAVVGVVMEILLLLAALLIRRCESKVS